MNPKQNISRSKEHPILVRRNTPVNLNTTALPGTIRSASRTLRPASASKLFKVQSLVNFNSTIVSSGCPNIKNNLIHSNIGDNDNLECEMVYNDYLQALLKKEIVSNAIKKHEQEIKDQLAIQKDNLHKTKLEVKKIKKEIKNMETMSKIKELIDLLQHNVDHFLDLNRDFFLTDTLNELVALFETMCNKLYVKGIKPIIDQESIDKLTVLIEKCAETFKKVDGSSRPVEAINKLGTLMKKYQHLFTSITESQKALNEQYQNETSKLLEYISDMYAEKGNYVN